MPDEITTPQSRNVVLAHYQQEFVNRIANASAPARYLLSSPPGAGKGVALAATAGALQARYGKVRCLVIAPGALAAQWQDQIKRIGGIDAIGMNAQTYRRLQAETGGNINVWSTVSCVTVSIDFLKADNRIDEALAVKWDLVMLDEVHQSTESTQRGNLTQRIWNAAGVAIAIATTGLPNLPTWLAEDAKTTRIQWKLSDLLRHRPLPQRRAHTIRYNPSDSERQLAARVAELVRQLPKDRSSQLTANLVLRRLGSSKYALEQTLRRLLTITTFGDTDLNDWSPDDIKEDASDATTANSVKIDGSAGELILSLLESEATDTKWDCCYQLLLSRDIGKSCSGIIFTDYADTAEYLLYLAKNRAINALVLTEASTADQRERAIDQARSAPLLLILTGALEGTNVRFTNQVIHYDLPWNPIAFQQRIGRVERAGSQFDSFDHYFIVGPDDESEVVARLMEKLHTIEDEWK